MIDIVTSVDLRDLHTWAGATKTMETIVEHNKLDDLEQLIVEMFGDEPVNATTLNDFLWFDNELIFSTLDIEEHSDEDTITDTDV